MCDVLGFFSPTAFESVPYLMATRSGGKVLVHTKNSDLMVLSGGFTSQLHEGRVRSFLTYVVRTL